MEELLLLILEKVNQIESGQNNILSEERAAELLGKTASTLKKYRCTKEIEYPYHKVGATTFYLRDELEEFIRSN